MKINAFLEKLKSTPEDIAFSDTITAIEANYHFTPTAFTNGDLQNDAGQNSGSCKLFSFAKMLQLSKEETLHCFGTYYKEVLNTPAGSDHQNIRNFMKTGWDGVAFDGEALKWK